MRVVVCGSRNITDKAWVAEAIAMSGFKITTLISGGARGVDQIAEEIARENGWAIEQYLPDWDRHGKKAGILRNADMVNVADAVIALWDGTSRGTKSSIDFADRKGIPCYVELSDLSKGDNA